MSLYDIISESFQDEGLGKDNILSFSHFVKVWNTDFKYLSIPKVNANNIITYLKKN